jgi:hypothetical protein
MANRETKLPAYIPLALSAAERGSQRTIHHDGQAEHSGCDTYKSMERIFYEQCEVHEEKVCVKKKTGGNVMQNPSDSDATYDGHEGPAWPYFGVVLRF